MKYAIVEISGRQFWIETGKYYDLNRIPTELGKEITLNRVLLVNNDGAQFTFLSLNLKFSFPPHFCVISSR